MQGGAIFIDSHLPTTVSSISRSHFVENHASQKGGAIFLNDAGLVKLSNNNFTGNHVDSKFLDYRYKDGGAIYYKCSSIDADVLNDRYF